MNKIGFDNFRRFIRFDPIAYKGITFLVGRNNAGKSTVVKALLLIDEYFKSKNFSKFSFGNKVLEDTNIVTYGRAKNRNAKNDFISFTHQILNYYIEIVISGDDDKTFANVQSLFISDTSKNLNYYFEPEINNITISRANIVNPELDSQTEANLSILENEIKNLKATLETSKLKKLSKEYINLIEDLNKLENKKVLLLKDNNKIQAESKYSFSINFQDGLNLKEIVDSAITLATVYHHREYDEIQKGKAPSKYFADYRGIKDDQNILEDTFDGFYDLITESSVVYLGSNPAKQSALFSIRDTKNALAQSIHDFYQLKVSPGEPAYEFIEKWMKIFEIGDSFTIEIYAGEAYGFKIHSHNTEIHLADKGMGSIQAMLLILRLASIIHKTIDTDEILTVIIEEPELNLHPALQSKLADLFLEVYEKCYHEFIIETHSEYTLRRSQVIVAEKEFQIAPNDNPFCVYYFPKELEQQPYRLEYQEDGSFNRNFGDGFFDEASSSTLELLKLKRQKKI